MDDYDIKTNPSYPKIIKNYTLGDYTKKHRYLKILTNKKLKKKLLNDLNYKIQPYPKGDNKRYDASYKPITQQTLF